jgi:hypothetical protein
MKMSGLDEQHNMDICPVCEKIPKEYHITCRKGECLWWFPEEAKKKRNLKQSVLLDTRCRDAIGYKTFFKEFLIAGILKIKCNGCRIDLVKKQNEKFYELMKEALQKAEEDDDFMTWKGFSAQIRRR